MPRHRLFPVAFAIAVALGARAPRPLLAQDAADTKDETEDEQEKSSAKKGTPSW